MSGSRPNLLGMMVVKGLPVYSVDVISYHNTGFKITKNILIKILQSLLCIIMKFVKIEYKEINKTTNDLFTERQ